MRTKKTYAEMKEHLDLLREKGKAKALAKPPLKRARKPLKRSKIRQVSKAMANKLKLYSAQRKRFLEEHRFCQFEGCTDYSQDLHHSKGRGKHLLDESSFLALCRYHHDWVHSNSNKARELGYLLKPDL